MKLLILLLSIPTLWADSVTFNFAGSVTNDPYGVFGSATFTGQYTFDSNASQVLNSPNSGGYAGSGGVFAMSVVFTGTEGGALDGMPFAGDTVNITVNNDFPGPLDQYLVTGTSSTDPNLTIELTLSDFTGTAFSGTQLPLSAPNLADFSSAEFALFDGDADNPIEAEGTLSSLTSPPDRSGSSGTSGAPVPEPSAVALCGIGSALLAGFVRRKLTSSLKNEKEK